MPELRLPWLELMILLPAIGAVRVKLTREPDAARRQSLVASGLALAGAVGAWRDFQALHLRAPCGLVDPEVDGHRVAQLTQCGEAHGGQGALLRRPGGRQSGEVAVGEGQRHDIRRRLPEIDRLCEIVKRGGCGGEDVHGWRVS